MLKEYTVTDEAMLRERLELAQRHATDGQLHVQRQRAVIRRLEREGHDSGNASAPVSVICVAPLAF